MSTDVKVCTKCEAEKPVNEFHSDRSRKDGLFPQCRECSRAGSKASYLRHRERRIAEKAAYQKENKEKVRRQQAAKYQRARLDPEFLQKKREYAARYWASDLEGNRAKAREWARQFAERHPDVVRERSWLSGYRSRAEQAGFTPVVESFSLHDVIERYGDSCFYCEGDFEHLDHYVPVSKGGPHTLDNVRPSCGSCNRSKQNVDGDEWIESAQPRRAS